MIINVRLFELQQNRLCISRNAQNHPNELMLSFQQSVHVRLYSEFKVSYVNVFFRALQRKINFTE